MKVINLGLEDITAVSADVFQYSFLLTSTWLWENKELCSCDLSDWWEAIPSSIPTSPVLYHKLRQVLDDMEEQAIIIMSSSKFALPLVLVWKKNVNLRIGTDFRWLNAWTVMYTHFPIRLMCSLPLAEMHSHIWVLRKTENIQRLQHLSDWIQLVNPRFMQQPSILYEDAAKHIQRSKLLQFAVMSWWPPRMWSKWGRSS